ncbi:EMP24_GP25L-domain-containing protein [Sphaerulina musiva SO2202]|uniref:EMP24_GP25L-domain-containing protein n=1 Tax=Sphaerulina musiva (strain SO2202) TaxID=692275 RepID=N1QFJ5_SPHMS|nr:EMP24_GP25L-domain-containing protein [Sphaerulina musiva SO2202]EMF11992.1 EMP24_GP25L-domain-containing protein [Sphaerulina musiva SO2202]
MLFSTTALLGLLTSYASATALTYKFNPNEHECFYAQVDEANAKIAFYFAVQSGGDFDIDYSVFGPEEQPGKDKTILSGTKERQGDFIFTATKTGEYRFCFANVFSTFSDKVVDFDISVENEPRANLPTKGGASVEQLSSVEETIMKLSGQVSTLNRQQKYFRTRENRNFSTVRSTEKRIFNMNVMETIFMIAMAGLQVFIVKMFFTGGRKGYV